MVRKVVPPPEHSDPKALRMRMATRADASFIADLSAIVFSQFGDYSSFLPSYLEHPSVLTSLCERQDTPLGFLMLALVLGEEDPDEVDAEASDGPEGNPEQGSLDAEVLAIAVSPDFHNTGVGKRLMQHAIDISRVWHQSTGVRSLRLNVADTNLKAIGFFQHMGFKVINPEDGVYPKGQRSIRMARFFDPED
jgi:ribosomal protein S18 acetylase RimI-like enzyme